MIYVFEGRFNEASKIYDPTGLSPEKLKKALVVDELPEAKSIDGQRAILKVDVSKSKLWYEYVDVPLSESELQQKVQDLEQQLQTTQEAIDFLIMMGGM